MRHDLRPIHTIKSAQVKVISLIVYCCITNSPKLTGIKQKLSDYAMDSVGKEFGKGTVELACLHSVMSAASAEKPGTAAAGGFTSKMASSFTCLAPGLGCSKLGSLELLTRAPLCDLSVCLGFLRVWLIGSKREHSKSKGSKRTRWKLSGLF